MNRYKITFSDLRFASECIEKKQWDIYVEFLNSFSGVNVYEKFKNFLEIWANDVSPHLSFKIDDTTRNISIKYLLSEMSETFSTIDVIAKDNIKFGIGVPDQFIDNQMDIIPIYGILKYIYLGGMYMDFTKLNIKERKTVIDSLPASTYNFILNKILREKSAILSFSHPVLEKFRLNFLNHDPYIFMKSMLSTYDDFYFRDIVYHLSPKIGAALKDSTLQDIDYFIKKLSEENQTESQRILG